MAEFNLEDNNLQVNLEPTNDLGLDLDLGNQSTTSLADEESKDKKVDKVCESLNEASSKNR